MNTELSDFLGETIEGSVSRHGFSLSDEGKTYLRGVMEHFADAQQLFQEYDFHGKPIYGLKPITLQHFEAVAEKGRAAKTEALRTVAEQCLFLVGFCYDHIRKNGMGQVRFHSDLGAAAYDSLAQRSSADAHVFPEIAEQFTAYCVVTGDLHIPELRSNPVRFKNVFDRWMKTHDRRDELLIEGVLDKQLVFDNHEKKGIN